MPHDVERTIIFKVQYVPGGDDLVTVWLNPNLGRGATEKNQPENLTTKFKAKATFNQIRLRQGMGGKGDGGNGWIFSDMAIATSFSDFVVVRYWQTWWFNTLVAAALLVGVGTTVRIIEKKKYQLQLQRAEQESALERERARIAQDLHDELGSSLTRISLLGGLLRADKDNPDQRGRRTRANFPCPPTQTVRALEWKSSWAVRPDSDTLQSLIEYTAVTSPTNCSRATRPAAGWTWPTICPRWPCRPVRHNIFLIIKEALTNALKHAAAREVRVTAKASGSTIEIMVADDGKGFTPAPAASAGERNGLGNMHQRAGNIGGKLDLQSAPGRGTSVRLTVNHFSGNQRRPARKIRRAAFSGDSGIFRPVAD